MERDDVAAECGKQKRLAEHARKVDAQRLRGQLQQQRLRIAVHFGFDMLDTGHAARAGKARGVQHGVDIEILRAVPAQIRSGELSLRMRKIEPAAQAIGQARAQHRNAAERLEREVRGLRTIARRLIVAAPLDRHARGRQRCIAARQDEVGEVGGPALVFAQPARGKRDAIEVRAWRDLDAAIERDRVVCGQGRIMQVGADAHVLDARCLDRDPDLRIAAAAGELDTGKRPLRAEARQIDVAAAGVEDAVATNEIDVGDEIDRRRIAGKIAHRAGQMRRRSAIDDADLRRAEREMQALARIVDGELEILEHEHAERAHRELAGWWRRRGCGGCGGDRPCADVRATQVPAVVVVRELRVDADHAEFAPGETALERRVETQRELRVRNFDRRARAVGAADAHVVERQLRAALDPGTADAADLDRLMQALGKPRLDARGIAHQPRHRQLRESHQQRERDDGRGHQREQRETQSAQRSPEHRRQPARCRAVEHTRDRVRALEQHDVDIAPASNAPRAGSGSSCR